MAMKVNYCGKAQQERMIKNGWTLKLAEVGEFEEELYERLSKEGYSQVKIYYDTTMIRGLHKYFAMVKR